MLDGFNTTRWLSLSSVTFSTSPRINQNRESLHAEVVSHRLPSRQPATFRVELFLRVFDFLQSDSHGERFITGLPAIKGLKMVQLAASIQ